MPELETVNLDDVYIVNNQNKECYNKSFFKWASSINNKIPDSEEERNEYVKSILSGSKIKKIKKDDKKKEKKEQIELGDSNYNVSTRCLKCKNETENIQPCKFIMSGFRNFMIKSKCKICNSNKSSFIKFENLPKSIQTSVEKERVKLNKMESTVKRKTAK